MELRRYFILTRPSNYELKALDACIGSALTQRYSLDGHKLLIKTNQEMIDSNISTIISNIGVEYSYSQIKEIMNTSEWTDFNALI